jgi:hypothetical protein
MGRKSYLLHNMRKDVAILCFKKYNSDKACFGPLLEGEDNLINKLRVDECSVWRRPITFQEAADDEGAIRREAARMMTAATLHAPYFFDTGTIFMTVLLCCFM